MKFKGISSRRLEMQPGMEKKEPGREEVNQDEHRLYKQ